MEEIKRRETEDLCKKFIPNGKSEEFIKMVGENKTFVNLFTAANGVGKSCTGANIVANMCFGPQNKYFDYPLFKEFPYLKKGRIISDPTTLKEKIVPELKKWFPSNRYTEHYATTKEGKSYEAKWTTDTGFEFDLMSNEQAAKEFESTDLGWIWFDEPSKKDIYMASVARLRRGGIIIWTFTPLKYSAWIKDDLYDKRDGVNVDYVIANVEDNCKEHGVRGILHHDNIQKMINQYPEDEKEARCGGKFGHLLGLVHKAFEPKIHVIDPFDISKEEYTVYMALDTHPRVPDATLWMAVDKKGQKYIIDEMAFIGTDVEYSAAVKTKESEWNIQDRLIDPSAFNEDNRTDEKSYADRLSDRGLRFRRGSKKLIESIRVTNDAFKYQMRGDTMIVQPKVFIFSNCVKLIRELQNYVWDEYAGRNADEKSPKPTPKDKDDHYVEDLHRLLIEDNFIYREERKLKKRSAMMNKYKPRVPGSFKLK